MRSPRYLEIKQSENCWGPPDFTVWGSTANMFCNMYCSLIFFIRSHRIFYGALIGHLRNQQLLIRRRADSELNEKFKKVPQSANERSKEYYHRMKKERLQEKLERQKEISKKGREKIKATASKEEMRDSKK